MVGLIATGIVLV